MPLTLWTCSRWNGPSQQRKPRLGHTSESVGERISFSPPLIALSNSLAFACAHCPLSLSPLCIYWSLCTIQKRALFVLVLAGGQKQRDGYGWEWPDSASVLGLCPNTETLLSCPSVFREEPSICLFCCYAVGCWLTYLPGLSKKLVCLLSRLLSSYSSLLLFKQVPHFQTYSTIFTCVSIWFKS